MVTWFPQKWDYGLADLHINNKVLKCCVIFIDLGVSLVEMDDLFFLG